jgi:bifunctional DNase/RNase
MAPRSTFVMLTLLACALGAVWRMMLPAPAAIELRAQDVLRLRAGMPVLVLLEKNGLRRLPVPLGRGEAALIERSLRRESGLAAASVEALGGRVLRACIDQVSHRTFRAYVSVGSGSREVRIEASAGEALALALEAGAPIFVDPDVFDAMAVSPEELSESRGARSLHREAAPAPVQGI